MIITIVSWKYCLCWKSIAIWYKWHVFFLWKRDALECVCTQMLTVLGEWMKKHQPHAAFGNGQTVSRGDSRQTGLFSVILSVASLVKWSRPLFLFPTHPDFSICLAVCVLSLSGMASASAPSQVSGQARIGPTCPVCELCVLCLDTSA